MAWIEECKQPGPMTKWCCLVLVSALLGACGVDQAPFEDHDEDSDFDPPTADGKADGVPAVFDKNHVVDDLMLVGSGAMTVEGIQEFFEHSPYGTRSWLADATIDGKSAAQAVMDAATAQDIDPIALIARMQVESSLVSKTSKPSTTLQNQALGCGCPDGGSCSGSYKGLGKQLVCGATIMRKWYDASVARTGEYQKGKTTRTLDGSVKPTNDATASLYSYTPWVQSNRLVWSVFAKYVKHATSLGVFTPGAVVMPDPDPTPMPPES